MEQREVNVLIVERLENIKDDLKEMKECQDELFGGQNDLSSRVTVLETRDCIKSKWICGIGISAAAGVLLAIFGLMLDTIL